MKFDTVKKPADIRFSGCRIDLDVVGDTIKAVTLTDADGNLLRIVAKWEQVELHQPAVPTPVERFRVAGNIVGVEVNESYDDRLDADRRASQIQGSGGEVTVEPYQDTNPVESTTANPCAGPSADDVEFPF